MAKPGTLSRIAWKAFLIFIDDSINGIIEGWSGRLDILRSKIHAERNNDIMKKASDILDCARKDKFDVAERIIYGLIKVFERYANEPDLGGGKDIYPLYLGLLQEARRMAAERKTGKGSDTLTIETNVGLIKKMAESSNTMADFVVSYMNMYRRWMRRNAGLIDIKDKGTLFRQAFLAFIADKNIARGSPEAKALFARCYQAVFSHLNIRKLPNPLFNAISITSLIAGHSDFNNLLKPFQVSGTVNISLALERFTAEGKNSFNDLPKEDKMLLFEAINSDFGLTRADWQYYLALRRKIFENGLTVRLATPAELKAAGPVGGTRIDQNHLAGMSNSILEGMKPSAVLGPETLPLDKMMKDVTPERLFSFNREEKARLVRKVAAEVVKGNYLDIVRKRVLEYEEGKTRKDIAADKSRRGIFALLLAPLISKTDIVEEFWRNVYYHIQKTQPLPLPQKQPLFTMTRRGFVRTMATVVSTAQTGNPLADIARAAGALGVPAAAPVLLGEVKNIIEYLFFGIGGGLSNGIFHLLYAIKELRESVGFYLRIASGSMPIDMTDLRRRFSFNMGQNDQMIIEAMPALMNTIQRDGGSASRLILESIIKAVDRNICFVYGSSVDPKERVPYYSDYISTTYLQLCRLAEASFSLFGMISNVKDKSAAGGDRAITNDLVPILHQFGTIGSGLVNLMAGPLLKDISRRFGRKVAREIMKKINEINAHSREEGKEKGKKKGNNGKDEGETAYPITLIPVTQFLAARAKDTDIILHIQRKIDSRVIAFAKILNPDGKEEDLPPVRVSEIERLMKYWQVPEDQTSVAINVPKGSGEAYVNACLTMPDLETHLETFKITQTMLSPPDLIIRPSTPEEAPPAPKAEETPVPEKAPSAVDSPLLLLRDIRQERELSFNMIESIFSLILSGHKAVFTFDNGIGGIKDPHMPHPLRIMRCLKALKDDKRYKDLLKNLIIIEAPPENIHNKLREYLAQPKTAVFVFARGNDDVRGKLRGVEYKSNVNLFYIDETQFASSGYYPLPEIVTIALQQYLNHFGLEGVLSDLKRLNVDMENDLGIAVTQPQNGVAIFLVKILPISKPYDPVARYANLEKFLISA